MEQFLLEHASAIFGLAGAFGTAVLGLLGSWVLSKRDYDLKLWDKLLERRIHAHENLISVALEMRVMVALGGLDEKGELLRAPQVLLSKEEFEKWWTQTTGVATSASTWLSTGAKREMNFLQDYLITLHHNLAEVPSDKYLTVGSLIRQDFVDLSSSLEASAFSFFERDIHRLRLSNLREWHKHPRAETERRLKAMQLFQRWEDIQRLGAPP